MPLLYYFSINFNIKVTVVKDRKEFETKYPLYEAVNRCSRGKEHAHTLDSSAFFFKARQVFFDFLIFPWLLLHIKM